MPIPVQVVFHGLAHSPALESLIHELAAKACHGDARATSCQATVELPHRHHRPGRDFSVRVHLHVAGGEVVVERTSEDAQRAAREAFAAVRRQLDETMERARGETKHHAGHARDQAKQAD
ncbi:MAG TPA: HPF/RaiA family ribosome-associated protein [Ramlibacter sp.]|uniref:HPF/RaiA family ribosome-associated protein n=1 Tax=Ramlibacter sp. TaxID=1917967 RepID=UPI002ED00D14